MEQQIIATSWWMVDLLNLFMLYAFVMNYPVGPKHSHAVTYHQIGMFKKSSFEKYGGVQRSGNSVVKIQNGLLQHWCIQACWKFNVIFFNPKHFFGSPAQKIHSFCFACAFWFCEIFVTRWNCFILSRTTCLLLHTFPKKILLAKTCSILKLFQHKVVLQNYSNCIACHKINQKLFHSSHQIIHLQRKDQCSAACYCSLLRSVKGTHTIHFLSLSHL